MPQPAKPKLVERSALTHVQSAGAQEDHHEAARALAAKLGWDGDPDWVTNDIAVADAKNFLGKVMHEHFIAGAKGEPLPDPIPACDHLGLSELDERAFVADVLKSAHGAGHGAEITHHPIVIGSLGAATVLKISDLAAAGKGV